MIITDRPLTFIPAIALAYALLGAGGLLLAIPPGYASPVFPAAGLALALVLQYGRRALPGIWLGSAVLNAGHAWLGGTLTPATALLAMTIAIGPTLQAWVGSWLVNRWQGPSWRVLELERDAFRFLLLGGVLAGGLSASIGATALYAFSVVTFAEVSYTWWNWYVGDVLGVLVFAPLSLCLLNRRDPLWRDRLRRTVLPVLVALGLAALTFYGAARWETQIQGSLLQTDGEAITDGIADRLISHREVLASLRHFIEATPDFSFHQFQQFTRITLQDNPDIFALSFNDLVTDAERLAFEERISGLSPLGKFQITERDSERRLVRAATRPEYVTVRFIVPLANNQPAVGYDIHSEPHRRAAIERARATHAMAVTAPILLVQELRQRVGLLALLPVEAPPPGEGQDSPRLIGFAVAVIKVDEMIDIATRGRVPAGLIFHLSDLTATKDKGLLYRSDAPVAGPSPLQEIAADWSTGLRMGDRDWVLSVTATEDYRQQHRPWLAWAVGVVGLVFATLLQVQLLAMTGRTAMIQRKNAQLVLAEKVFDNSGEAIVVTDEVGLVLATNPAFTRVTGYSADEVRGRNLRILHSSRQSPEFDHDLWQRLKAEGRWQGELWNQRKNGEVFPEWLTISAVLDADGSTTHYVGAFSDITEPKAAQEQIAFLAYHDPLTCLPNRALGTDRVQQAIAHAERHGSTMALLFIDLDRFKLVNDSFGHSTGDNLLRAVADRLRQVVRKEDTLCRLSGDEFMIVLYEAGDNHAISTKCETILLELRSSFALDDRQINTSCSIGVTVFPEDGGNTEFLMRNADTALYEAKTHGRNTYRFYNEQMNLDVVRYVRTRDALRLSLERGELELFYQPQISLGMDQVAGRVVGAEALIRWNHPELGLVMPGDFISVAEESGLIVPIGEWVLRQACRQAAAWRAMGLSLPVVAVNLSAVQFRDARFDEVVLAALADAGLDANCLELELTETILVEDIALPLSVVGHLKEHGVRLSIDDFGTGYSSLAYLKRFKVDKLKIDRSFIRDLMFDPDDLAIVRAIIQMAKSLNMKTVAEGVDDKGVLNLLADLGCDEVQGYLYARPLSAKNFTDYLLYRAQVFDGIQS
jgi:diguanylate cyclase